MLKSKRRIRRKKRSIHWKLVLWLFVIINISLGLMFSPITTVHKARVSGARTDDEARIAQHLQSIRKTPYFRLNSKRLETLILANDEIKSVDTKTNIFGRAYLKIENRRPVAKISGYVAQYLCAQGMVFSSTMKYRRLPNLEMPTDITQDTPTAPAN